MRQGRAWILGWLVTAVLLVAAVLVLPAAAVAAVAPQPGVLYVKDGSIWRYDGQTGTCSLFLNPDGIVALAQPSLALGGGGFAYTLLDLESDEMLSTVVFQPAGLEPMTIPDGWAPQVSPDGMRVLYNLWGDDDSSLEIYDPRGGGQHWTVSRAMGGSWSPDGRFVVYATPDDEEMPTVQILDLEDESRETLVINLPGDPEPILYDPAWSPRGDIIAMKRLRLQGDSLVSELVLYRLGSGQVQVSSNFGEYWPGDLRWVWTPEKDLLLADFMSEDDEISSIYSIDYTNGGEPTLLVENASFFGSFEFGPVESPFTDVGMDHPYFDAVLYLFDMDVIAGYGDGRFGPDDQVRRGQFAKMIVKTLGWEAEESLTSPFTDLGSDNPLDLYPHEYVALAWEHGITKGQTATTFNPWGPIKRVHVISMVARAAGANLPGWVDALPPGYNGELAGFNDKDHGQNAKLAEVNGILDGIDLQGWDLWAPASRAEVAQMLYNMVALGGE